MPRRPATTPRPDGRGVDGTVDVAHALRPDVPIVLQDRGGMGNGRHPTIEAPRRVPTSPGAPRSNPESSPSLVTLPLTPPVAPAADVQVTTLRPNWVSTALPDEPVSAHAG